MTRKSFQEIFGLWTQSQGQNIHTKTELTLFTQVRVQDSTNEFNLIF